MLKVASFFQRCSIVKKIPVFAFLNWFRIQMIARSCGKSDVHHLEPEDMAALSLEASAICNLPLAGTRKVFGL